MKKKNYCKELRSLASHSGFKPEISNMLLEAAEELNKYKEKGKWYVRCNSAEDDILAVVLLNDFEYKAVVKFFEADIVSGGGYAGTCYIIKHPFNTKEEAMEAIENDTIWSY